MYISNNYKPQSALILAVFVKEWERRERPTKVKKEQNTNTNVGEFFIFFKVPHFCKSAVYLTNSVLKIHEDGKTFYGISRVGGEKKI